MNTRREVSGEIIRPLVRSRYFFGRVTVGLGPGMKPISDVLAPAFKDDTSALGVVEVSLPMGMVFEESETLSGKFEVRW